MGQDSFWGHESFWEDDLCSWQCGRRHDTFPRVILAILFFGIFGTVEMSHALTALTGLFRESAEQGGRGGGIQYVNLRAITHKKEEEGVGREGSVLQCVAMCCSVSQFDHRGGESQKE